MREQREWLLGGAGRLAREWRLLANPSVMGQTWNPALPDDVRNGLRKVKLIADDMQGPDFDQWDGYPAERDALFDYVIDHDDGQRRRAERRRPRVARTRAAPAPVRPHRSSRSPIEFVTPSLTSQNLDDKMGWARHAEDSRTIEQRAVEFLPHWEWVDLDSHGYVVVDVTPERLTAEWWHLDTVLERSPNEELGAAFSVTRGTARLERLA